MVSSTRSRDLSIRGGQRVGAGPIGIYALNDLVGKVRAAASHTQCRDNPVLVTMKVLKAAGMLTRAVFQELGPRIGLVHADPARDDLVDALLRVLAHVLLDVVAHVTALLHGVSRQSPAS